MTMLSGITVVRVDAFMKAVRLETTMRLEIAMLQVLPLLTNNGD